MIVLVLLLLGISACGTKVRLYAEPSLLAGGVHVKVYDAYARGDRIYVKSYLTNTSSDVLRVDRDGWSLRLPSGEILPRSVGVTTRHDVYSLAPNEGHEVFVDFRKEGYDLSGIGQATLIVGGIGYGSDVQSRIAGEIPMSVTAPAPRPQLVGPPPAAPASVSGAPPATAPPATAPPATAPPATAPPAPAPEGAAPPPPPPADPVAPPGPAEQAPAGQ